MAQPPIPEVPIGTGVTDPNAGISAADLEQLNQVTTAIDWRSGARVKGILYTTERQVARASGSTDYYHAFRFQYNPASLRMVRELEFGEIDPPGSTIPSTFFVKARPDTIEFTLQLQSKMPPPQERDRASLREHGVTREISALMAFTHSSEYLRGDRTQVSYQRPPQTVFALGRYMALPVWVQRLELTILEWTPLMLPIRTQVDVTLLSRGVTDEMMAWLAAMNSLAGKHVESVGGESSSFQRFGETLAVRK